MGVKLASAEEKLDSEGRCIHSAEDVMSRVPTSDDTMIGFGLTRSPCPCGCFKGLMSGTMLTSAGS